VERVDGDLRSELGAPLLARPRALNSRRYTVGAGSAPGTAAGSHQGGHSSGATWKSLHPRGRAREEVDVRHCPPFDWRQREALQGLTPTGRYVSYASYRLDLAPGRGAVGADQRPASGPRASITTAEYGSVWPHGFVDTSVE
jgi:hypothetical protein